jgi:hypothetical protein
MKTPVNDIIDYFTGTSAMYQTPPLRMLLRIGPQKSFTKIMSNLIKKALIDLELKCPLFMLDRTIFIRTGLIYEFSDNYDEYLSGQAGITKDTLELVPLGIVHYTRGLLTAVRDVDYVAPIARFKVASMGRTKLSYFAKYPFRWSSTEDDEFTDDSHIFGLIPESGGVWKYFICLLEQVTLMYLRDQKAQMTYVELPFEFFNNIEGRLGELENELQEFYQNPTYYSNLLM